MADPARLTLLPKDPTAPIALADAHAAHQPGDRVSVRAAGWPAPLLDAVIEGAGFALTPDRGASRHERDDDALVLTRKRTLADTVGPGMHVLTVGLNPSLFAADAGVGFARPGNRFWPAALAAGLVTCERDPHTALRHDGLGMTDMVKRATTAAAELVPAEYGNGLDRLRLLVAWLEPSVICVVGLAGWRAAVDARATAGAQDAALESVPVYLMPSTSGLNSHASLEVLTEHFRAVRMLAG